MTALLNSKADELNPTLTFPGGFCIVPPYTTAERDALTGLVNGIIILNSTTGKLNTYVNAGWEVITSA